MSNPPPHGRPGSWLSPSADSSIHRWDRRDGPLQRGNRQIRFPMVDMTLRSELVSAHGRIFHRFLKARLSEPHGLQVPVPSACFEFLIAECDVVDPSKLGHRVAVGRIECDRPLEMPTASARSLGDPRNLSSNPLRKASYATTFVVPPTVASPAGQAAVPDRCHIRHYLVLQDEHFAPRAVVALGPQIAAGLTVD